MKNYFKDKEFACKCCGKGTVDQKLKDMLNALRAKCGFPIVINSAYRCEANNSKVGGVKDSEHVLGYAVDVKCTDSSTRYKILKNALEVGFTRLGIDGEFIHLGIDPSKAQCVVWVY